MDEYNTYLETALANSQMQKDFTNKFEEINNLLNEFRIVSMTYDEIINQLKEAPDKVREIILKLHKTIGNKEDCPLNPDLPEITDKNITDFYAWLKIKYLEAKKFADKEKLPIRIEFRNQIKRNYNTSYIKIISLSQDFFNGTNCCIDVLVWCMEKMKYPSLILHNIEMHNKNLLQNQSGIV